MIHRSRASPAQRGWGEASSFVPGSNGRDLANTSPEADSCPAPSIWTLTLGLIAFFLVSSFVTASLATHFGWLNAANAPFEPVMKGA